MIDIILSAVRKFVPQKPIQFIAGHSHMRKERLLDQNAAVFEPGNYFNTLGLVTFDLSGKTKPAKGT